MLLGEHESCESCRMVLELRGKFRAIDDIFNWRRIHFARGVHPSSDHLTIYGAIREESYGKGRGRGAGGRGRSGGIASNEIILRDSSRRTEGNATSRRGFLAHRSVRTNDATRRDASKDKATRHRFDTRGFGSLARTSHRDLLDVFFRRAELSSSELSRAAT